MYVDSFAGQVMMQLSITLAQIFIIIQKRRIKTDTGYITELVNETALCLLYYVIMGYGVHVGHGPAQHVLG